MSESLGTFFFLPSSVLRVSGCRALGEGSGGDQWYIVITLVQEPSSRGLASSSARGPDLWLGLGLETDEKPQLFKAMIELRF